MTTPSTIFVTGATGAIGIPATTALVRAGHRVVGAVRSPDAAARIRAVGGTPVEVDLFDPDAVREAVWECSPAAIIHLATKIPEGFAATRRRAWRTNDRLRRQTTAALLETARAARVSRVVFASIALAYPDRGAAWIDESTPLRPCSSVMQSALDAEGQLTAFRASGGAAVSLRFGRVYGPGRASAELVAAVRARAMPIVGRGENFVSSVHADDAGRAVREALDAPSGTYNVVDDEPVSQRAWMTSLAGALGAAPPRSLARPLAHVLLGHVAAVLTVSQRVSNRRWRDATGWAPRHGSVRDGCSTLSVGESTVARDEAA